MVSTPAWGIEGRRCVAADRLVHQLRGLPPTPGSALELSWDNGEVLLLDVDSDLTLLVSSEPWCDPYADCGDEQRDALAQEVGLWTRVPVEAADRLAPILGATAHSAEPLFNSVREMTGIRIVFDVCILSGSVTGEGMLGLDLLRTTHRTRDPGVTRRRWRSVLGGAISRISRHSGGRSERF